MRVDRYDYERVELKATLKTLSPLHIGSGDFVDEDNEPSDGENKQQNVSQLCLDCNDQPYLPGSSLRGYLRRQLTALGCDAPALKRLLGEANDTHVGNAGCLSVCDAFAESAQLSTRSRTAINPITGTAKQNQLFSQKEVLPGTEFKLCIVADKISETDLQALINAVSAIGADLTSGLGKGQSRRQGLFKIPLIQLKKLTKAAFVHWLSADQPTKLMQDIADTPGSVTKQPMLDEMGWTLYLIPITPLLINDPEKVATAKQTWEAEQKVAGKEGEKALSSQAAKLIFSDQNGCLLVPAATLKGWLRGHARKVLMTINAAQHDSAIDRLLDDLFGSQDKRGLLKVSDAVSKEQAQSHYQVFNAVDRFTGGVADGALFDAESAWASHLKFDLILDKSIQNSPPLCALLALVLRDACEGDCRLGWGKNKGFGLVVMSTQIEAESWGSMRERLGRVLSASDEDVDALWEYLESNTAVPIG